MKPHHPPSRIILSLFPILFLLSSCSFSRSQSLTIPKSQLRTTSVVEDLPRFEEGDCRFDTPLGKVICGDLYVLEDRTKPDGTIVTLHVAIFPSFSSQPLPDPVIYLMGGGGGDALAAADFYMGAAGNRIRAERDFILYNQRGVKRNEPYLACPGEDEFWSDIFSRDINRAEEDQLEYEFLMGCRDHLQAQGIDLDLYDSIAHAADLSDLIHLLGYQQANIYGTSYGTRLGLTLMRHHPDVIRSAILDGVLPPQIDFPSDAITSFVVSVENLFAACAAQEKCSTQYPELEDEFYAVIEELKTNPATISIDGEDLVLDHILFLDAIYMLLHPASALPDIPRAIHNASNGKYSRLTGPISSIRSYSDFVATGVSNSSMCRDEVLFDSMENSQAVLAQYPEAWQDYFDLSFYFNTCQDWVQEPADEIENTPVISDIPALVMAGHFDSITSPAWCQETASYLENSYYYEFPNMAHGTVRYDDCALSMALDFLDDPWSEPDSICMEDLRHPEFH